jgi:hypothetical protein
MKESNHSAGYAAFFSSARTQHSRITLGIWLDNDWRRKGWDISDFSKNHFSPAAFEYAVGSALRVSDQYVWIYTEQPRWWTKEKLPEAYLKALENAQKLRATESNR